MNSKHSLFIGVCGLLAMSTLTAATSMPAARELLGNLKNTSGEAVAGATVFVYTAAPKSGTSPLCPSCYPDCGKTAKSDPAGNFAIPSLSSQLVFRLLVVAKGYVPKFVPSVEPNAGRLGIVLDARQKVEVPVTQMLSGKVVSLDGQPVYGAVLEVLGVGFEGGRNRYGGLQETDPLVVTDEKGEFVFASNTRLVAIEARISARLFANQAVRLAMGQAHTLTLTEGAKLSGRVTLDGKPLANVSVGVSPEDRRAGSFVGNFEVGTDADGRFSLTNLPPKSDYHLYGKMETVGRHGSIPVRPVHLGRDGETTDVGDLAVRPALRVSGRVVLEGGERLPEKSRLLAGRDDVSDSLSVDLGTNGEFELQGIPPGIVTLSVRVPGYKTSAKNQSYEAGNRRLVGRVDTDIAGLEMLLDARDPNEGPIFAASLPRPKVGERPQDRPLRGIESQRK